MRFALWAWIFAAFGLAMAVMGPALPELRQDFAVPLAAAGLLFTCNAVGYLVGVLACGAGADRMNTKTVAGVSVTALGAALVLGALAPSWPLLLAAMLVAGCAFGGLDVTLNAAIARAVTGTSRRAAALNLLHGAFPVGTLAAPAGFALALQAGFGWRAAFGVSGAAVALSLLGFLPGSPRWDGGGRSAAGEASTTGELVDGEVASETAAGAAAASPAGGLRGILRLLGERRLRVLAILQGLYVGVELGIAGWVATFLVEWHGADPGTAALATSGYWGGFLVGRPLAAWLTHRYTPQRLLPWMLVGGLLAGVAGALVPGAAPAAVAYALSGVAIAGVFPSVLAMAVEGRHGDAGAVTALIVAVASVGGMVWPWLIGAVAQVAGLQAAMLAASLPLVPMLGLWRGSLFAGPTTTTTDGRRDAGLEARSLAPSGPA